MIFRILKKLSLSMKLKLKNKYEYECLKICGIYLIIGVIWVYFSDRAARMITYNDKVLLVISTYKGWFYVSVTALILYFLIRQFIKKVESAEIKFAEVNDELTAANEELEAYVQQLAASEEELRINYDQLIESERKLRLSEQKNKAIIKAIPDLMFVLNNEGRFIDCLVYDSKLLYVPKEAFIGKTLQEVIPEEISKMAWEKMKLVLVTGEMEMFEYRLDAGNEELHFELRMVRSNENEILAIVRNITEKRKIELEIKASEERYRMLINEMNQGIAFYVGGSSEDDVSSYVLVDANENHEKLMRIKTEDSLGKSIKQLLPSLEHGIIDKLNNVIKTGKSCSYDHYYKDIDMYLEIVAYRPKALQLVVLVNDVTLRKKAEDELKASENNFRSIFENSSDAILLIEDTVISDCNRAALELFQCDSKEVLLGKSPASLSPEEQPDRIKSHDKLPVMYKNAVEKGKYKFDWWHKTLDGRVVPVEIMVTSIFLNGKKVYHCLLRDISERKDMEHKLEYLSYHDQLTGLYNRRYFEEELLRIDVERRLPLTVVMSDVNGLKLVNDSFGHAAGDELLKKVSEIMKEGLRSDDIVARLGGDEFVILLPNTSEAEAEQIIDRIKALASKEKVGTVDISISFGYEAKTTKEEKVQDILKKAEDFMYKKKLYEGPSMRGRTINAIISALHEKNKREEQHSHRVSLLCETMGIVLGLTEDAIKELKTVGLLHDIGKIAIEENILNKPAKLTESEWKEMKKHPEIGYRILSTVNELSELATYVLAHHERYDGKGYPKGLKGEEIPFMSRIISIADSYDAMTSVRSYNDGMSEEAAVEELTKNAGSQFDPELVKIFIDKVIENPTV